MRLRETEIVEIGECAPLDAVINRLEAIHRVLARDAQATVAVEGDDNFGWRLKVAYSRELTAEERQLRAKYAS